MIRHKRHLINFRRTLMIACWAGVFVGSLNQVASGQQPDRNGWAAGRLISNQPVSLNPPALNPPALNRTPRIEQRLATDGPDQQRLEQIPNEIRAQIGLATFFEPLAPARSEPTGSLETQTPDSATDSTNSSASFADLISSQAESFTSRDGIQSSLKVAILLAALSLAPALILMSTCYIRVVVVLSLLKQAFGGQQLPPTQVLTALSMFLTFLIMSPVWNEVKTEAIDPYSAADSTMSWDEAWQRGVVPIRNFMIRQIEMADNTESVAVFYKYLPENLSNTKSTPPTNMSDVPLNVLLPAFMVSELKVAFLLGFQVYLPFLVLDLVVSSVTVSMGMVMLPPNMVSFPLKLILFVMVDGWNLVVGMLLQSFG